jgi:hydroxypyruvate isomerase
MRRREFIGAWSGAALAAAQTGRDILAMGTGAASEAGGEPFPLSVMLWTVYRNLPYEARLEKVAEAGYRAVELVEEYQGWSKEQFAAARGKKESLGITVDACSGIHRSLCDPRERDALLNEIRAKLATLEELECSKLILLTGDQVPGLSRPQMHANVVEALKRAAELCAPKKVELLLENIDPEENPKYFLTSVAEGFEIVRETSSPNVKFLYDFFHEQISEGNLIAKLDKNIALIGLVHIADVPGRHEPGTGEINFANIYRKLGQLGYSRYAAMEFIPSTEPLAALRAARDMAVEHGRAGRAHASNHLLLGRQLESA